MSQPAGRVRRWLPYLGLVLGGLAMGIVMLGVVEVGLRLLGVTAAPRRDPFAGFSRTIRMFQPTQRNGIGLYQLSPGRTIAATGRADAGPQRQFLAEKRPGDFRIFVLGDSSAAGVPYGTGYAFSSWLARRLQAEVPAVSFEVVNAAMPGYASRRLAIIAEELTDYAPDLVIVYVGHNEFAERRYYAHLLEMDPRLFRLRELLVGTRLWAIAATALDRTQSRDGEEPHFDMEALDAQEQREMFAVLDGRAAGEGYPTARERQYGEMLYRFNLQTIIRTLRDRGVRVMLVTPTQNFASWAPGASAHRAGLTPVALEEWTRLVAEGNRLANQEHDCPGALDAYRRALALDDQYADLIYRVAGCEEQLGRFDDARRHYREASDLDQVPHGAPTRFNDILRATAQAEGAMIVDADAAVTAAATNGLVGDDLFTDWVHPNIRAHQIIAAAIATAMRTAGVPVPSAEWVHGTYTDPAPETLLAAQPNLRTGEHIARIGTCLLAHREDCALAAVDAILAADPENPWWQRTRNGILERAASWKK